jgi:prophage tail gpP-like protein
MDIGITIEGESIIGWESVSVSKSMNTLCGDFGFTLTNFPDGVVTKIPPEASVQVVMIDLGKKVPLITGYVDRVKRSKTARSTSFAFSGRDKTADLIDCSAIYKDSTWKSALLSKICRDICGPYGINVIPKTDATVKEFTLQTGETAFDSIDRLCRAFSILPQTDNNGSLVLTNVGVDKIGTLEVGKQILEINIEEDNSERFSNYIFKGQGRGNGSSWTSAKTQLKGEATDSDVTRDRFIVFNAERHMSNTEIADRAAWEAQVRAGKAINVDITVAGWLRDPAGGFLFSDPWETNQIVTIVDSDWDLNSELLITNTTFTYDNSGGKVTQMTLNPPEIFKADPSSNIELSRRSSVRPS